MPRYLSKRESASTNGEGSFWCAPDAEDRVRFPALCEFMAAVTWEDGSRRVTGTLTVFAEDGMAKCCLNDRSQGLVAFASADSLLGLLDAAEAILRGTAGSWRKAQRQKHSSS